jgi:hypothetical protein
MNSCVSKCGFSPYASPDGSTGATKGPSFSTFSALTQPSTAFLRSRARSSRSPKVGWWSLLHNGTCLIPSTSLSCQCGGRSPGPRSEMS